MQNIRFPLNFHFKIFTPSNDFSVFDAEGKEIAYTRQKIFKIKESVQIFRSSSDKTELFNIQADRIIDFNAVYTVRSSDGTVIGKIRRHGMKSLWKTSYVLFDEQGREVYRLRETNPMVALVNGLIGEIPLLGSLTGYFLNPTYALTTPDGQEVYRLKKEPSFFERKFSLDKLVQTDTHDDVLVLNAVMMVMLLERGDG